MRLILYIGLLGYVCTALTPTPDPNASTTSQQTVDDTQTRPINVIDTTTSTINNTIKIDSLTMKNGANNKDQITTTMISAVKDDKVVNKMTEDATSIVNEENISQSSNKNSETKTTKTGKNDLLKESIAEKGTPNSPAGKNNAKEKSTDVDKAVGGGDAAKNADTTETSLDILVDRSFDGEVEVISNNKVKPEIHIGRTADSTSTFSKDTNQIKAPAIQNPNLHENTINKMYVAGDVPSMESNKAHTDKTSPEDTTANSAITKSTQKTNQSDKTSSTYADLAKQSDVKNNDNVPPRKQLGAEISEFEQHSLEGVIETAPNQKAPIASATETKETSKNNDVKITRKHDQIDKPKSGTNSMVEEVKHSAVKNRENVPSRSELVAMGAENVDMVQHRIDAPWDIPPGEPDKINKAKSEVKSMEEGGKDIVVKNRTNVPSRSELVAMDAENVDMVQHRIDGPWDLPPGKTDKIEKPKTESKSMTQEVKDTVVKNRENVPSRSELVAVGGENMDMVQHRIDGPRDLPPGKTDKIENPMSESNRLVEGVNDIGVKNRTNVPSRSELVAMGADNVDMVQHRIDGPRDRPPGKTDKIENPMSESNRLVEGVNDIGVKNRKNVPSRSKLVAMGAENVDLVQHRIDGPLDLPPGKLDKSNKLKSETETATNSGTDINLIRLQAAHPSKATSTKSFESNAGMDAFERSSTNNVESDNQIPKPKQTTQTTLQSQNKETTTVQPQTTENIADTLVSDNKTFDGLQEVTDRVLTSKNGVKSTETTSCPLRKCTEVCRNGYKKDSNGCNTCECKYSNKCPRIIPVSNLLCLLRVRTRAHQTCETDADCRRQRICCPGSCGSVCRRESRNRSMLLSMLAD